MKKILFFLIFPFILAACAPFQDNTPESHSFFAMGTYMKITAYGKNSETAFLHVEKEIRRLDTLLSAENPDSEISRLSKEGKLILSEDTVRLISLAESWNRSTGGTFDISLAPLSKLWGFPHGPYHVPTETERAEALGKTGMKYISCNKETGEYFLNFCQELFGSLHDIEAYTWDTGCSDYFADGREWWGTYFWTVYSPQSGLYTGITGSATD